MQTIDGNRGGLSAARDAHGRSIFPIFHDLPSEICAELWRRISWREVAARSVIVSREDLGDEVYFIATGIVRIVNYSESGRVMELASLPPGSLFGELSAIDGGARSATALAKTQSRIGILSGADLMELVSGCGALAVALLRHLASVIRADNERIESLIFMNGEQRVCMKLVSNMVPDPGDVSRQIVYPVPSQVELANGTGVTRQSVVRIFRKLMDDNVLERHGRMLRVCDQDRLRDLALGEKRPK